MPHSARSSSLLTCCDQPGVRLTRRGALDVIEVENNFARFAITPFGATVLEYQPHGRPPVLWQSPQARLDGSKAIRGGIPICWPWFGDYPDAKARLPAHGLVRNRHWALESITATQHGGTELKLRIDDNPESRADWPHSFDLALRVSVGETLELSLMTTNTGTTPFTITEALHAYFAVDDAGAVQINGLDGVCYLDKLSNYVSGYSSGTLALTPPWDRVYQTNAAEITFSDHHSRQVRIVKHNSNSTIVWNPGPAAAAALDDMPDQHWQSMVCIEPGNALTETVEVLPGSQHTLVMQIAVA